MITILKTIHVLAALLSILGFLLRGYWAWRRSPMLAKKPVKILPHVIDTVLLLSAIGLLFAYGGAWVSAATGWIVAKVVLLVVYIGLGFVALKPWYGAGVRVPAFIGAVAVFVWIVAIARAHAFVPFAG